MHADGYKQLVLLICEDAKCNYTEFPGCSSHNRVMRKVVYDEEGAVKGVACSEAGCTASTMTSTPFSVSCRHCRGPKPVARVRRSGGCGSVFQMIPTHAEPHWTGILWRCSR